MKHCLILALLVAAAAPAAAQIQPRAPVISEYGACVARQMPERARAVLTARLNSPEERSAAASVAAANGSCVRQMTLSMRTGEVRGTIATALLKSDAAAMARLAALPSRRPIRAENARGRGFIMNYARCVVEAEPAKSAAVIATPVGSAAEHEAVLGLGSTLKDCTPAGVEHRVDRFDLRNHLAAYLYVIALHGPDAIEQVASSNASGAVDR